MTGTLSFAFLRCFGIAVEVGSMFTIAEWLVEVTAVNDEMRRVKYQLFARTL